MRHRALPMVLFLAATVLPIACSIEDEDRCADGYSWDEEFRICKEDSALPPATGGSKNEGGAGGAGSAELGTACESEEDCAASEDATFCLKSPLAPSDPGICTIPDCTADACDGDYLCCDCSTVTQLAWPGPLCVLNDRLDQLEGAGCSCE